MARPGVKDDVLEFNGLRLVGGQPGLDLLNTVKYRGKADNGDRFIEFSDIIKWAYLTEIIDKSEYNLLKSHRNHTQKILTYSEICEFREETRIIFDAGKSDSARLEKAVNHVECAISQLRPTVQINHQTGVLEKYYPIKQPQDLKFRIIACIDNLLQKRALLTIKTCSGLDCDWLFADETKAKRRKWCDTRTCGNLARVRRYRTGSKHERI